MVRLDVATCVYKCSLYTVGGCIYKLGKFVMANWYVAGIYSGIICIQKCIQYIYQVYVQKHIHSDIYSEIFTNGIYSEIQKFRYSEI